MRTCVCNTYACTSSERATCVCACIHVGRQACHLCVREYTWADVRQAGGVHVRATGGHVGRQAGLQEKLEILKQFSEMETPHAKFKTFPIARAHVKSIYYPLPPIVRYVGLCWFMLNLCWFEVPQTLDFPNFMLVCYNFLYFSRKNE